MLPEGRNGTMLQIQIKTTFHKILLLYMLLIKTNNRLVKINKYLKYQIQIVIQNEIDEGE